MVEESAATVTRAPKRASVVEDIRRRIVAGELPPGSRLPSRTEMTRVFGASKVTLQGALDELKRDGFVESRDRSGTFVTEKPPHLSRYAFVLGPDPDGHWQPFTAALRRVIVGIEKELGCEFAFFENVTARPDTFEHQEVLRDIRTRRVAGLLFCGTLSELHLGETPIATAPGVPRVAITGNAPEASAAPGAVSIITAQNSVFADRALTWLCEQRRRRVALLAKGEFAQEHIQEFVLAAERRGVTIKPCWIHDGLSFKQARRVTELLMSPRPGERADGIIMVNESLIEPVGIGILAAGVRTGSDVDIVAYSNMPCVGSMAVPMRRLGIDVRQRLRVALDLLDRQQRGEPVPPCVLLSPVFEEELSRSASVT